MTPQPRRKKWTEAEERTLIDKYGEMACNGTLSKMKTREKKYKPISLHVNSLHHVQDPSSYPWQWTWKDVCTKVQNMRHQYSLVKQKIKTLVEGSSKEEFDWMEGNTYWPNFLRYKEVFGDMQLIFNGNGSVGVVGDGGFEPVGHGMDITNFGPEDFDTGIENGVMDLEFNYDAEEEEENLREDANVGFDCEDIDPNVLDMRKKRKVLKGVDKKSYDFLDNQLSRLIEMETQFEQREVERDQERQRRKNLQMEMEKERERKREAMEKDEQARNKTLEKLRSQWIQEMALIERESEEKECKRKDEESVYVRECEERLKQRRSEWKRRMDEMMSQHRTEMGHIQARILHEQQNLTSQLLGIVSQWTSGHYLSQMMQHVNGMVHDEETPVEGDNQEDQFIVDG